VARATGRLSALLFKCQVGFSVTVGVQVGWPGY